MEEPQFLVNEFLIDDKPALQKVIRTVERKQSPALRRAQFLKAYTFALFRVYTKKRKEWNNETQRKQEEKKQLKLLLERKKQLLLQQLQLHQQTTESPVKTEPLVKPAAQSPPEARPVIHSQTSQEVFVRIEIKENKYIVHEPILSEQEQTFLDAVIMNVPEQVLSQPEQLHMFLAQEAGKQKLPFTPQQVDHLRYYLVRDRLKFGVLSPYFEDSSLQEILCNGPDQPLQVSADGHSFLQTELSFPKDYLDQIIQHFAQLLEQTPTAENPFVTGTIKEFTLQANISTPYAQSKFILSK
ncbi:hypothetical protein HZB00_03970 [Candidatus Woesearchaeota archaeon]|nr:hypothetical protein [Candidatus Woesearchaeota archaeon]